MNQFYAGAGVRMVREKLHKTKIDLMRGESDRFVDHYKGDFYLHLFSAYHLALKQVLYCRAIYNLY
jgi:hypothetical protein